jgi:type VI secretion system secreted protein VgrG
MEHEGIFYFFRHADGKHTLVLADSASSYTDCPESPVEYSSGSLAANHILSWEHHYEFRSGKWSRTDYNFKTPSTSLLTTTRTIIDLPDAPKYEIFDYPGEYVVKGVGEPVTKVRMEEEEAGHDVVNAASQCCTFTPGGKFTLEKHDVAAENGDYMITSVRHAATEASYGSTSTGATYKNGFACIPASIIFRAPRATPKPMVQGVQTAMVTGPPGEKIHCDKYGRVKVHFHWDRHGKKDDDSSCWIRVSNNWGGAGWGGMFLPHIGQEVIVDFEEGDPDRPIVTGRVYNAECMPPLELPANKSKSAIRDHGGNEIIMEGNGGDQRIRIHSPHSQTTISMGAPNSPKAGYDFFTTAYKQIFVGQDYDTNVNGDKNTFVKGKYVTRVNGYQEYTTFKDYTQRVLGGQFTTVVGLDHYCTISIKTEVVVAANLRFVQGGLVEVNDVKEIYKAPTLTRLLGRAQYKYGQHMEKSASKKEKIAGEYRKEAQKLNVAVIDCGMSAKGKYAVKAQNLIQDAKTLEQKAKQLKIDAPKMIAKGKKRMEAGKVDMNGNMIIHT